MDSWTKVDIKNLLTDNLKHVEGSQYLVGEYYLNCKFYIWNQFARKDMDVNEHERRSYITLRHNLK